MVFVRQLFPLNLCVHFGLSFALQVLLEGAWGCVFPQAFWAWRLPIEDASASCLAAGRITGTAWALWLQSAVTPPFSAVPPVPERRAAESPRTLSLCPVRIEAISPLPQGLPPLLLS